MVLEHETHAFLEEHKVQHVFLFDLACLALFGIVVIEVIKGVISFTYSWVTLPVLRPLRVSAEATLLDSPVAFDLFEPVELLSAVLSLQVGA